MLTSSERVFGEAAALSLRDTGGHGVVDIVEEPARCPGVRLTPDGRR